MGNKKGFMSADAFGRTLTGFNVNLLVRQMEPALHFQREVLGTKIVHADKDFAVLTHQGAVWMLHSDATYHSHPLQALLSDGAVRGLGCELRLYGLDPDAAEARARALGYEVLQESRDKPHGLRECYLLDRDNYLWVPGKAI